MPPARPVMTARRNAPPRIRARASISARFFVLLTVAVFSLPSPAIAQARVAAPDSLTDSEFWKFFTSMSEPGGTFLSENFVSNEVSFQDVIPTLQKSLTKDGVYLGVGPEQNFTYIANLKPRLAVIFDIRRQNAMQHLMYKALFELSPTRAEFVSRLFSRPSVGRVATAIAVQALFDSASAALPNDSAYKANLAAVVERLTVQHGFALTTDDIATIEHVYKVFFAAGPEVNYGYRAGMSSPRSTYPSFGMLQAATNADTVQMAFLASEENYRTVRTMHVRNLIVPVVGDFGGPSAIRSVGSWLRDRDLTVTAFYVSNVEQYLFRDPSGAADRFYGNVSALPLDSTSRFIRSVPRASSMPVITTFNRGTIANPSTKVLSFTITRDSSGNLVTQTIRDSAGVTLMQVTVDSARRGIPPQSLRDSAGVTRSIELRGLARDSTTIVADSLALRRMMAVRDSITRLNAQWTIAGVQGTQVIMGGLLSSGLASMKETLDAFFLGQLKTYGSVVEMTRITGWR